MGLVLGGEKVLTRVLTGSPYKSPYDFENFKTPPNLKIPHPPLVSQSSQPNANGSGGFSKSWISNSWAFVQWAQEWNATAYTLEHRFYGDTESALLGNTSLPRLRLLSAEQALADAAVFIENVNKAKNLKNPRWIVFGGSYPGNLAAWMRLKYPQLVLGAVASSAPVEAKTNFYEYVQVVEESFQLYGFEGCADVIEKYFKIAEELIETPEGRAVLRICEPEVGI